MLENLLLIKRRGFFRQREEKEEKVVTALTSFRSSCDNLSSATNTPTLVPGISSIINTSSVDNGETQGTLNLLSDPNETSYRRQPSMFEQKNILHEKKLTQPFLPPKRLRRPTLPNVKCLLHQLLRQIPNTLV